MRTFSLLKGLPVFEVKTGNNIGEVCDLSISGNGKVKGLLLRKGALLKKTYLIGIEDVASFGWDGVMIEDSSVLTAIPKIDEYTFESHNRLTGKMMMSREGERLGLLEDVYFMEELGTIVGYELSDGFFSDVLEGKRVIKTDEPPAIGKDAIIVNVK
ncbi:PRC-barrel domain-containing protein [Bacillus sp. ISL-47]|uniref:PRC-barrel domain-containing protein n=1 Tax=Bacillus sp. ISL-47 TaxID=2819130 RepID=UPI001BE5FAC2|nr:PRC-barrel domain-containing protein [Bacillus sp. ISL-47]MBT2688026.1 PRC-barrel domain-containing protein [Bacillus sp. ISL-47]MBT2707964.1 PRC-barrel domain-containing protein [Pseudomonas sp. ISL-84]